MQFRMIFIERISLPTYLYYFSTGQQCLYLERSRVISFFERFARTEAQNIRKAEFDCVAFTTGIRRKAFEKALEVLPSIGIEKWSEGMSSLFGIDMKLQSDKFFFDKLYLSFEFIETAKRYCAENPGENTSLRLSRGTAAIFRDDLSMFSKQTLSNSYPLFSFLGSLALLPLLVRYQRKANRTSASLQFTNSIICIVDDFSTLEMFSTLFAGFANVCFVTEQHNIKFFTPEQVEKYQIQMLGLVDESYHFIKSRIWRYISLSLKSGAISRYGNAVFEILNLVIRGKAQAISGSNNAFITYEHLETVKSIRNNFMNAGGTKTIFVPKNAYASTQYFHSEAFMNYNVMCAAGPHTFDVLNKRRALTDVFLATGSYDNHRRLLNDGQAEKRIEVLRRFKDTSQVVTIISPGIARPTFSHEVKLMLLAQKLSKIKGVKVIIRIKPVDPVSEFRDFYHSYTNKFENILLTNKEYGLFDFLGITDLFVTSISNAASDIALCGGQVYYIDFLKDPELFLFWEKFPAVVIDGDTAFDKILNWLNDSRQGEERNSLKEKMDGLVHYLGYIHGSFGEYRQNLLSLVSKHLPAEC